MVFFHTWTISESWWVAECSTLYVYTWPLILVWFILVFISSFCSYCYIPYSDGQYVFPRQKLTRTSRMAAETIITLWRRLWGENVKSATDLGAGDCWRAHLCFKLVRKNSVRHPAVSVDSALNKWIWWDALNVSCELSQKTNRTNTIKDNAGKGQERSLCIKGIFTFSSCA